MINNSILHELAKEVSNGDTQTALKAEVYYKESIEYSPNKTMVNIIVFLIIMIVIINVMQYRESLAGWYLSVNYFEQCEQECVTILQIDPNNDAATVVSICD